MKRSSVGRLPKLERLLLDADINPELAPLLSAVGFQTAFAPRTGTNVLTDAQVVRLARKQRRILVCHDKHGDKATRLELYPEVYHNGGKILRIRGDSSQEPLTALGKVLLHREHWSVWLKENDGIVTVSHERVRYEPAEKMMARILKVSDVDAEKLKAIKPLTRKRRPKAHPSAQARMHID